MATSTALRCRVFRVWCIILFAAPSSGTNQFSFFSSDCVDNSYGEPWALKEILSLAATPRLKCASLCMQTPGCRGYSLDAGVCHLLGVVAPTAELKGCASQAGIPGTTYLVSAAHNERSERLRQCPYFSEWQATGRDDGEGEWRAGKCVCPSGKRGAFCNLGYTNIIRPMQRFNTTRSAGIQHVHINGADYLIEISLDMYNYSDPDTNAAIFGRSYRPIVYRYDATTQLYEFLQLLDEQDAPNGSATFIAGDRHYVVVHKIMYVFNTATGFFDRYLTLDAKVAHVSALKRRSGEIVIALADNSPTNANSLTLFWWPGKEMRKHYLPTPTCWTLKLFEVQSELYAGAASEHALSSVWHWNGTQWEMAQTLEQTNCFGYGLDVTTWNDVIYLVVTCIQSEVTRVFTRKANDRTFSITKTFSENGNYRPSFFSVDGHLYLAVPNFSMDTAAIAMIYRLYGSVFMRQMEIQSYTSYAVTVFEQHHDVYLFVSRRMNLPIWQNGTTVDEHLSWSPLFKFV